MTYKDQDYSEVTGTSAAIASGGGTGNLDLVLSDLPLGDGRVRIHEIILDSDSIDFDVAIHEDDARTRANRVTQILNINVHTVQLIGAGRGQHYQDREVLLPSDQGEIHFAFVNNDVGAETITARVRYTVSSSR